MVQAPHPPQPPGHADGSAPLRSVLTSRPSTGRRPLGGAPHCSSAFSTAMSGSSTYRSTRSVLPTLSTLTEREATRQAHEVVERVRNHSHRPPSEEIAWDAPAQRGSSAQQHSGRRHDSVDSDARLALTTELSEEGGNTTFRQLLSKHSSTARGGQHHDHHRSARNARKVMDLLRDGVSSLCLSAETALLAFDSTTSGEAVMARSVLGDSDRRTFKSDNGPSTVEALEELLLAVSSLATHNTGPEDSYAGLDATQTPSSVAASGSTHPHPSSLDPFLMAKTVAAVLRRTPKHNASRPSESGVQLEGAQSVPVSAAAAPPRHTDDAAEFGGDSSGAAAPDLDLNSLLDAQMFNQAILTMTRQTPAAGAQSFAAPIGADSTSAILSSSGGLPTVRSVASMHRSGSGTAMRGIPGEGALSAQVAQAVRSASKQIALNLHNAVGSFRELRVHTRQIEDQLRRLKVTSAIASKNGHIPRSHVATGSTTASLLTPPAPTADDGEFLLLVAFHDAHALCTDFTQQQADSLRSMLRRLCHATAERLGCFVVKEDPKGHAFVLSFRSAVDVIVYERCLQYHSCLLPWAEVAALKGSLPARRHAARGQSDDSREANFLMCVLADDARSAKQGDAISAPQPTQAANVLCPPRFVDDEDSASSSYLHSALGAAVERTENAFRMFTLRETQQVATEMDDVREQRDKAAAVAAAASQRRAAGPTSGATKRRQSTATSFEGAPSIGKNTGQQGRPRSQREEVLPDKNNERHDSLASVGVSVGAMPAFGSASVTHSAADVPLLPKNTSEPDLDSLAGDAIPQSRMSHTLASLDSGAGASSSEPNPKWALRGPLLRCAIHYASVVDEVRKERFASRNVILDVLSSLCVRCHGGTSVMSAAALTQCRKALEAAGAAHVAVVDNVVRASLTTTGHTSASDSCKRYGLSADLQQSFATYLYKTLQQPQHYVLRWSNLSPRYEYLAVSSTRLCNGGSPSPWAYDAWWWLPHQPPFSLPLQSMDYHARELVSVSVQCTPQDLHPSGNRERGGSAKSHGPQSLSPVSLGRRRSSTRSLSPVDPSSVQGGPSTPGRQAAPLSEEPGKGSLSEQDTPSRKKDNAAHDVLAVSRNLSSNPKSPHQGKTSSAASQRGTGSAAGAPRSLEVSLRTAHRDVEVQTFRRPPTAPQFSRVMLEAAQWLLQWTDGGVEESDILERMYTCIDAASCAVVDTHHREGDTAAGPSEGAPMSWTDLQQRAEAAVAKFNGEQYGESEAVQRAALVMQFIAVRDVLREVALFRRRKGASSPAASMGGGSRRPSDTLTPASAWSSAKDKVVLNPTAAIRASSIAVDATLATPTAASPAASPRARPPVPNSTLPSFTTNQEAAGTIAVALQSLSPTPTTAEKRGMSPARDAANALADVCYDVAIDIKGEFLPAAF